jgi:hypothetical protein
MALITDGFIPVIGCCELIILRADRSIVRCFSLLVSIVDRSFNRIDYFNPHKNLYKETLVVSSALTPCRIVEMSADENHASPCLGRRSRDNALQLGPRKRPYVII